MKKVLLGAIAIIVCFAMVGCGNKENEEKENNNVQENSSKISTNVTTEENNTEDNNTEDNNEDFTKEDWEKLQQIDEDYTNDIKESVSELTLTADNNKYEFQQGDNARGIYYHDGTNITGYEARVKYDSKEEAELAKNAYQKEEGDNIESVKVVGNEIVVTYSPEEYEGTTLEEIKQSYDLLKIIQGS